jgi:hypothetical protein
VGFFFPRLVPDIVSEYYYICVSDLPQNGSNVSKVLYYEHTAIPSVRTMFPPNCCLYEWSSWKIIFFEQEQFKYEWTMYKFLFVRCVVLWLNSTSLLAGRCARILRGFCSVIASFYCFETISAVSIICIHFRFRQFINVFSSRSVRGNTKNQATNQPTTKISVP